MLTHEQNRLLTSVEGDAPMARLFRETYWLPFSRIAALKAGEPPVRVRLLGENYVAFRTEKGRLGFIDERCPHRGASMALARVEGCNLRCLFHGWVLDVTGKVIDIPTEGEHSQSVAERVPVSQYKVHEAGGLAWVFLGAGEPPVFPDFPWLDLPTENLWLTRSVWPVNWLQGVEAALDSAHVAFLHSAWPCQTSELDDQSRRMQVTPRYITEDTDYGMRAAAVRICDDGQALVRISEFIMPLVTMTPGSINGQKGEASLYLFVPVDDHSHLQFFGFFSQQGALGSFFMRDRCTDPDNYVDLQGSAENNWTQDRALMAAGHFSGYPNHVLLEDAIVQVSMGPVTDRTRDFLTRTDIAVQRCRHLLLDLVDRFDRGEPVDGSLPAVDRSVISRGAVMPAQTDWRTLR
jgi:phenylpropionate dioxygenase-like ring-hydroxylating dioxygenase large terminal subunit